MSHLWGTHEILRWTLNLCCLISCHLSFKAKTRQTSLAALLPTEIFAEIFSKLVGENSENEFFENTCFNSASCNATLLCAARVCKPWFQIIIPLLYEDVRITSYRALQIFLNTVKHGSFSKFIRVSTVTYLPPSKCDSKRAAKGYLTGCRELIKTRDLRPALANATFSFTLSHSNAYSLITPEIPGFSDVNLANISSLTLSAPGYGGSYHLRLGNICFPNLRRLTLQQFGLTVVSQWPETPNLECLRLIDATIFTGADNCDWLQTPKRLSRLELVNVYNETNFVARLLDPAPLGCGCRDTLEDLVIYKLCGPDVQFLDLRHISSLKNLKRVCIGPLLFRKTEDISTYLPMTIERLTIWEPEYPENVFWPHEYLDNRTGLAESLKSRQFESFQRLRTIRVKGLEGNWKDVQGNRSENEKIETENLAKGFEEAGIRLEIKLFPGEWLVPWK